MAEKKIVTKFKFGFEGYAPIGDEFQFHGYYPVGDKFSCIYTVQEGEDSDEEVTLCFFLDKEEGIYLEDIMLREMASRRMASDTVYGGDIFMTCIVGSNPIISIPKKEFSFRFYYGEDYGKFLEMITNFIDNSALDEKLQELRKGFREEREACSIR